MNNLKPGIALAAVLAGASAQAAPVQNVKPEQLADFLAKHDTVLVQFTSFGRECPYCIGADRAFARAVAPISDPRIKFVRVQWAKWDEMPDLGTVQPPWGMPQHNVYRRGEPVGTIYAPLKQPKAFRAKLRQIRDNPGVTPDPYFPNRWERKEKHVPLSARDEGLVRLMIRKDMVGEAMAICRRQFPEVDGIVAQAYDGWVARQQGALDRAARVMLERSSREDAHAIDGFAGEEKHKIKAWTATRLDIPLNTGPTADSCIKIASNLDTLSEFRPAEEAAP